MRFFVAEEREGFQLVTTGRITNVFRDKDWTDWVGVVERKGRLGEPTYYMHRINGEENRGCFTTFDEAVNTLVERLASWSQSRT